MKPNRRLYLTWPAFLFLSFFLSLSPLLSAEDDDAPELPTPANPNVAKNVRHEDAPLDHKETKNAAQEGVRLSGAGDPLKKSEPVHDEWIQSGKFPHDRYEFIVGSDGKIYGKGQTPPPGETKTLTIDITHDKETWFASAEISHEEGDLIVTDNIETNLADGKDMLETDKGKGFESQLLDGRRRRLYYTDDPAVAVRSAIVRLQNEGSLYDPSKEVEASPAPSASPSASPSPSSSPKRQAHHVHGSRQAHPVHGSSGFGETPLSSKSAIGRDALSEESQAAEHPDGHPA